MKKAKRCLALLIAMIMMVTVCIGNGSMTAFADGVTEDAATEEAGIIESSDGDESETDLNMAAIEEVASLFEQLPKASEVENMSEEELNEVMQQTVDAMNAFDGLGIDECDYFIENYSELYSAVMEDLSNVLAAMRQGDVSTMSLLPLEEVEAYLILNGKTDEELKTFSVDEMLNSMVDREGNPISVFPSDATTVWRYVKDQDANVENYEEYSIGTGETIDLTTGAKLVKNSCRRGIQMLKQTTLSLKKALYLLFPSAIDVLRRPHTKLFLKTLAQIT